MRAHWIVGFIVAGALTACSSEDAGDDEVAGDVGEVNAVVCKNFKTIGSCERNPKCDWVKPPSCDKPDGACSLICVDAPK